VNINNFHQALGSQNREETLVLKTHEIPVFQIERREPCMKERDITDQMQTQLFLAAWFLSNSR